LERLFDCYTLLSRNEIILQRNDDRKALIIFIHLIANIPVDQSFDLTLAFYLISEQNWWFDIKKEVWIRAKKQWTLKPAIVTVSRGSVMWRLRAVTSRLIQHRVRCNFRRSLCD